MIVTNKYDSMDEPGLVKYYIVISRLANYRNIAEVSIESLIL